MALSELARFFLECVNTRGPTDRFSAAGGGGRMRLQPGDGFATSLESLRLATTDTRVAVSASSAPHAVGRYTTVIGRSVESTTDDSVKVRTAADGSVAAWLVRRVPPPGDSPRLRTTARAKGQGPRLPIQQCCLPSATRSSTLVR